jgi:TonB-dependent receptor
VREETRTTDRYDAEHRIAATYGMVDLAVGARWRFALGVRVERSSQEVLTFDPFDSTRNRQQSLLENTDPLPAINAIYSTSGSTNLRFGYSQTISRPDFRELAPFDFTDVIGGRTVLGNPDLLRAKIHNFDARWEWFPGGNQLVAASFFFKEFDDPIEQIVQSTVGLRTTFGNANSARNYGVELEFRRSLVFVNPMLNEFSLSSNFTYVHSRISLTPDQAVIQTSQERDLAGQSPFVFNVAGEWNRPRWRSSVRTEFNSVDRRISDVGTFGLPDIYEERSYTLDAVYRFSVREDDALVIRFSAENLTDNAFRWTQGGEIFRQFNRGRTFSIGTSFRFL